MDDCTISKVLVRAGLSMGEVCCSWISLEVSVFNNWKEIDVSETNSQELRLPIIFAWFISAEKILCVNLRILPYLFKEVLERAGLLLAFILNEI